VCVPGVGMRNAYNILVEKPEDVDIDIRIIFKWILRK
jgi:hypothetical protein